MNRRGSSELWQIHIHGWSSASRNDLTCMEGSGQRDCGTEHPEKWTGAWRNIFIEQMKFLWQNVLLYLLQIYDSQAKFRSHIFTFWFHLSPHCSFYPVSGPVISIPDFVLLVDWAHGIFWRCYMRTAATQENSGHCIQLANHCISPESLNQFLICWLVYYVPSTRNIGFFFWPHIWPMVDFKSLGR